MTNQDIKAIRRRRNNIFLNDTNALMVIQELNFAFIVANKMLLLSDVSILEEGTRFEI